ncbi:MAG: DUF4367 domain-containing protein [Clostridia bacterium]|nr:DUF4367 domain-containing protein [Clostridia bacterium]
MTNNQIKLLKEALLEEELAEMAVIDALPDEKVVFSEKYKIEIQKLLNKHKKYTRNANRFIPKRLVGVLAAILITLTLIMSISSIREPVVKFIVNTYESFISIFVEEDEGAKPPETIEKVYLPSCEIDEFHIQKTTNYGTLSVTTWKNNNNEFIRLEQTILEENYQAFLHNKSVEYTQINMELCDVYYMEKSCSYYFVWSNNGYIFKMKLPNTIELSEIEKIIESMEVVED